MSWALRPACIKRCIVVSQLSVKHNMAKLYHPRVTVSRHAALMRQSAFSHVYGHEQSGPSQDVGSCVTLWGQALIPEVLRYGDRRV